MRAPVRLRLLALHAALLLAGCGPVIQSTPAQMKSLTRHAEPVPGTPGRAISYLRAGDPAGQRVIFIHGTPGDATAWADFLTSPLPGLDLLAVDRLGFGDSVSRLDAAGRPDRSAVTSFAEQAASIEPLLEEHGGRKPIVVGHSLGGPIAAAVAALYSDRVGGLIILAGSLDPALEKPRWYNNAIDWAIVSWMVPTDLRTSNREIFAGPEQTRWLAGRLADIRCPVVILHGRKDQLVPFENVAYMKSTLTHAPSVRVVEFPASGHFIPWEHAREVREAITSLTGSPAAAPDAAPPAEPAPAPSR